MSSHISKAVYLEFKAVRGDINHIDLFSKLNNHTPWVLMERNNFFLIIENTAQVNQMKKNIFR